MSMRKREDNEDGEELIIWEVGIIMDKRMVKLNWEWLLFHNGI
jgi:hypothetical protein